MQLFAPSVVTLALVMGCRPNQLPPLARDAAVSGARKVVEQYVGHLRGSPPNADSLAALFATDGAILNPGMAAVRGPDRIRTFLHSFGNVTVDQASFAIDTIETDGTIAYVWGWATQRYQLPGQQPGQTQGRGLYVLRKQPDGRWLITKALTQPAPVDDSPPPQPRK